MSAYPPEQFTSQSLGAAIAIEKLSQNKPKDIEAITDWFRENERPSRSVAYWMKRQGEK